MNLLYIRNKFNAQFGIVVSGGIYEMISEKTFRVKVVGITSDKVYYLSRSVGEILLAVPYTRDKESFLQLYQLAENQITF